MRQSIPECRSTRLAKGNPVNNQLRFLAACAAVMILASPAISCAKDLCLSNIGGKFLVLRNFKIPKAGSCGAVAGNSPSQIYIASGSACTTTDGTSLQIHWLARGGFDDTFEALLFLPLPAMTGGSVDTKTNWAVSSSTQIGISAAYCKGDPVP